MLLLCVSSKSLLRCPRPLLAATAIVIDCAVANNYQKLSISYPAKQGGGTHSAHVGEIVIKAGAPYNPDFNRKSDRDCENDDHETKPNNYLNHRAHIIRSHDNASHLEDINPELEQSKRNEGFSEEGERAS